MRETFSVHDIASRFDVTEHTVLSWINSGELRAVNVGRRAGMKKPRWRITRAALEAFERLRSVTPPRSKVKRRKCQDVIEFYK